MNYIRIDGLRVGDYKKCTINAPGYNVVLWCSGCDLHCKDCHNSEWWNFNCGKPFDDEAMNTILMELKNPIMKGLVLLGGEPMAAPNIDGEILVAKTVKEKYPNKIIWVFSGHLLGDLLKDDKCKELLDYCDYLVDGPFISKRRNISLKFRGSDNQIIWEKVDGEWVKSDLN